MKFLTTFRLAVCVHVLAVAMVGSTVAQDEAVLLYETNYNQGIGLRDTDAPMFRHFYNASAKSSRRNDLSPDTIVAPFETPPLSDGFSGSFVFDTNAPARSEFAARITDFQEQLDVEGLRLYVGISAKQDNPNVDAFGAPETSLGILDSRLPGSKLEFVRFDINEWQVSAGVVNYDINISYWGHPALDPENVDTKDI
jgi:hypothetical protein